MMKIIGIARATMEPELREIETKEGTMSVCRIRAAVDGAGRGLGEDGFFNFLQYGAGGTSAAKILKKGQQFFFEGRLEHRTWSETVDGEQRTREATDYVGRFVFLDKKQGTDGEAEPLGVGAPSDKDIPF